MVTRQTGLTFETNNGRVCGNVFVVGAKREAQKDLNNTNSRFISECSDTMT